MMENNLLLLGLFVHIEEIIAQKNLNVLNYISHGWVPIS